MKRYVALGAVLTALGAGGTALGQKAAAGGAAAQAKDGGLSVMPAVIEHNAQPGALATMTVANRSAAPLDGDRHAAPVGAVGHGQGVPEPARDAPRRQRQPGDVHARSPAPRQQVTATLTSAPSAGYLYGAMEVVGVPTDAAKRKGVVLGYRLVGSLRILPAAPKYRLTAGNAKAVRARPR